MDNGKKWIHNIWNWKGRSLFVKTLWQLCLLIMVPLCGIIGLSYFLYNNMRENEIRQIGETAVNDIAVRLEQVSQEFEKEYSFISYDNDIELFLFDSDRTEQYYSRDVVERLIKFLILTNSNVSNIYIYNGNNDYILDKNGVGKMEYHAEREMFLEAFENQSGVLHWVSNENQKQYLLFFRSFGNSKKNGIFFMKFDVNKLLDYINFGEQGEFYIEANGRVLLSNREEYVGVCADKLEERLQMPDHNQYYASTKYLEINHTGETKITVLLERSWMKSSLSTIGNIMIFFVAVMFFVTFGLALWVSNKIYRPFHEILALIKESDEVGADGTFEGKDELEFILKSIEKRTYFDESISNEMARRLELLKKAQAVALQSQINPHFINNTLENINQLAIEKLGNANEVSEMVRGLADMLRNSLGGTGNLIPLGEEIRHSELYLKIMKLRHRDKFDVIWEVEEQAKPCKVIRIILQPLLENAIFHGIGALSNKGILRISIHKEESMLLIVVGDNGLGMSEQKIEELYQTMKQDVIQENYHIGLTNIYQRLKLFYGDACELTISSKLGRGTEVALKIPVRES